MVESTSMKDVQDLCFNLLTVCHPLEISPIPVEERIMYLQWGPTVPPVKPTSWARLKRLSVLKELNVEKNIWKYAGDLSFVLDTPSTSTARLYLVPWLSVRIEGDGKKPKNPQSKLLPRLLHPKGIGEQLKDQLDIPHPMNPDVWWDFGEHLELENNEGGLYKFAKGPKGDTYRPPFAICSVPILALQVGGVVPELKELSMFHEGMAVGSCHLDFPAPTSDFMRWTYERYIAAPLERGNHVEVKMESGWVQGRVEDVLFEELVVVRLEDHEDLDVIDVPANNVRRRYRSGDAVKVIHSSNIGREGFVFNVNAERVEVLDRINKKVV